MARYYRKPSSGISSLLQTDVIHILPASTSNKARLPNRTALPIIRGTSPQPQPGSSCSQLWLHRLQKPKSCSALTALAILALISIKQKCPSVLSRNSQDSTRSSQCNPFCLRVYFPWQSALQKAGRRPPATSTCFPEDSTVTPNQALMSQGQRPHSQRTSFASSLALEYSSKRGKELETSCERKPVLHLHPKRKPWSPCQHHQRDLPQKEFMLAVLQTTSRHTRTTSRAPPSSCQDANQNH